MNVPVKNIILFVGMLALVYSGHLYKYGFPDNTAHWMQLLTLTVLCVLLAFGGIMPSKFKNVLLFTFVISLILNTGFSTSWNSALGIFNMGLISAIMALGVNMQWGYAGLFNIGVMGFVALGGLAAVIVSKPPITDAWIAGGTGVILGLCLGAATIIAAVLTYSRLRPGALRTILMIAILVGGFFLFRSVFDPGVAAVEGVNPALEGYLGGLGLPIILSWPVGGLLAAGAAWIVGKTALGLRSDYLAIATLGIAEIIIAVIKNEDWLSRGVKNVVGLDRPVPYEIDLQQTESFVTRMNDWGFDPVAASSIAVKLGYAGLFAVVLLILLWLSQAALKSPWGRMMRAIRDNEVAAEAMGKDVTRRHLQIFILGSAVCGLAGAMMTTLDGQLLPGTYQPLRFRFLVWVMVIVGGSGNNFGAVLGGFLIWWLWVMVEPMGLVLLETLTAGLSDGSALKEHLLDSAAHMRLLTMGLILLLVLRFSPRGLIPER
jgi:branched-chain amino acid transport system permease protein